MVDKTTKQRQARGSKNGRAILSEQQVFEIMELKGQAQIKTIAKVFGVTPTAIWSIHHGRRWSHLFSGGR
jgi:hypothetical protein